MKNGWILKKHLLFQVQSFKLFIGDGRPTASPPSPQFVSGTNQREEWHAPNPTEDSLLEPPGTATTG